MQLVNQLIIVFLLWLVMCSHLYKFLLANVADLLACQFCMCFISFIM